MSLYCKIKKRLGAFTLDVKFEATDENVALMGGSGCGKSMTLRCIAGVETPDSGKIIINGKTVFDAEKKINLSPQKRKVGFLFQDYALFPNMTVKKNIMAVMAKEKRCNIDKFISAYHLTGLEERLPSELSGGQKQRCALARMMACEPEIIMLDEPFSALDSYLRWQMEQEVISAVKEFGKTVLFVSHDRDEVFRISDKVVVMEHGKNEKICSKHALYIKPKTYTDALLIGCKNICQAYWKRGRVLAPDYGLELECNENFDGLSYLCIRTKRILPAFLTTPSTDALLLEYEIVSVTEGVFSDILMIKPQNADGLIRWEIQKDVYAQLHKYPRVMAIPRTEILLLTK
ncbi:Fe(3+) ions import ATP-binding protein FbpC [Anaerotignum neopropionicum]|uniref:Fe(3+) ions import ATP-binding protein FbpC n=1 Tax=Anaerotignum neopropionicum TaxID=36847 RepID=A0A136WF09_9FIRM|nr:ATP-binding cassette domain-containing protein [Anaerotignum neopropionicum]KXL53138.1 Fe(3+) ions import ATP-binding protein FbpC [Anaerotignum neopropionicum]